MNRELFRGETFFETELIIHPEFAAVREATQELTDYMDERIGFPLDTRPDYDALAPKFFEQFYALGTKALDAVPFHSDAWEWNQHVEWMNTLPVAAMIKQAPGCDSVYVDRANHVIKEESEMDKDVWLARCTDRYMKMASMPLLDAAFLSTVAFDEDKDGDFTDDPEGAADADMEYWDDDGED